LRRRRVEGSGLVEKVGNVAEDKKTMGQAGRDPQLPLVFVTQLHAYPPAPRGAAFTDVDGHVVDGAASRPNQLALRMRRQLVVQAAQNAALRSRMVILDEGDRAADGVVEQPLVEALREESALVPEDLRLENQYVRNGSRRDLHQNTCSASIFIRYCP